MFSIQIEMDSAAAQARIDQMLENIKGVGEVQLAVEFNEWQQDDMKRDKPNLVQDGWTVTTSIWPTSRTKMVKRARLKFEPRRITRGLRPILRPELFQTLCTRMEGMLRQYINWPGTK
jgi:hypothetical protein